MKSIALAALIVSFCSLNLFAVQANQEHSYSASLLHTAILNENLTNLLTILKGSDPSRVDGHGVTPLAFAAINGKLRSLRTLVELGANLETHSRPALLEFGETAFIAAGRSNQHKAMRLLKELGAEVDAEDTSGDTLLVHAALSENHELMVLLAQLGANLDRQSSQVRQTALSIAASAGKLRSISSLVGLGAKINAQVTTTSNGNYVPGKMRTVGRTALMDAASWNRVDAVKLLLSLGADPNLQDQNGGTALHFAATEGAINTIRVLLKHGANPELWDATGFTPLLTAVGRGQSDNVIWELLAGGASPFAKTKQGETSIALAERMQRGPTTTGILYYHMHKTHILSAAAFAGAAFVYLIKDKLFSAGSKLGAKLLKGPQGPRIGKVLEDKIKRAVAEKRAQLEKSLRSEFHARPFSFQGETLQLNNNNNENQEIEHELRIYEQYLRDLESAPEAVVEDEEGVRTKSVVTKTAGKKPRLAKQRGAAPARVEILPRLTRDNIFQAKRFSLRYETLEARAREAFNARIQKIIEDGVYGDLKDLRQIIVVEGGERITCRLFELRFHDGTRVYFTSIDGESIHLLAVGDKTSQKRDINSFGGELYL